MGDQWLAWNAGFDVNVASSPAYEFVGDALRASLNASDDWRGWWHFRRTLKLYPFYREGGIGGWELRRRPRNMELSFDLDGRALRATDPDQLASRAQFDVRAALEWLGAELDLGPSPAWPAVPSPPDGLPLRFMEEDEAPEQIRTAMIAKHLGISEDEVRRGPRPRVTRGRRLVGPRAP